MALSRGAPPRPQPFMAQADAQPFAALLDAAVSPPDSGAAAPAASASPSSQKPGAETGGAAQDRAAASASAPSAGNAAQGSAAPASDAPTQSASAGATQGAAAGKADDGKPVPALGVNGSATLASVASANGAPLQTVNGDGTHQTIAKNGGDRKTGATPNPNQPAIVTPVPMPSSGSSGPTPPKGTSADATGEKNDPAAQDAGNAEKDAANNTAAAAVAAIVDLGGSGSASGVTLVATKPAAGGKDDNKDQQSGSADAATVSPAASGPQLPSPDAAQPVAAAVVVNAAPDPGAPPAAKPGLTIADAVKGRVKVTVASVATEQTTPAQDDTTDAPGSSSAVDSGATNASPASSGPDDATASSNLQQAIDRAPAPSANGVALLGHIDFASLGGTEHFGLRGDTATSPNGAAVSAAPNGAANAATAPSFGIFAPGVMATNAAAPAAGAPEPAVPLAGLAVAIAGRAQAGSSQFDIRLDPPELGRIDVRLDVDGSGQVRTHVTVDRADTLQLLQSQQPQLERALEQAGLKTADNGLQFTLRDQSFAGQNGGSGGQQYANQPAAPLVIPDMDAAPIDTAQIYARLRLGNGLDISV